MKKVIAAALLFVLNCSFNSGAAQEVSLARGRELLKRGAYPEAISVFEALLQKDSADENALEGLVGAMIEVGDYSGAEARVRGRLNSAPSSGRLRAQLGQILLETGRYSEAADEFERAGRGAKGAELLRAKLGSARALMSVGKDEAARVALKSFVSDYSSGARLSAEEMALLADCLVLLEEYRQANELFMDAREADPSSVESLVGQGILLNEKYNYGDAASLFEDALKINPNSVRAHAGLAESKRLSSNEEPAAAVDRALKTNPNFVPALVLRARLDLEAERRDLAAAAVDKALAVNPYSIDAMAVRAAAYYIADRRSELAGEIDRALATNPRAGEFFETLAHFAVINRRYRDAVEFGRRAVELSPRLWRARTELGIQLLRVGRAAEGRAELERAFEGDPFNVWAKNTLDLLDSMEDYQDTVRGPFLIRSSPQETDALKVYAGDLLEEAHRKLTSKYRFTPAAPILVELFPNHEDFAVRSLGLPGLGALGVCFGQVIAMDSPSARPPGEFNWGGTLWHEYAHVITLQATDHRIPRWFSEGLSVYEERRARPGWGGSWSIQTLKAFSDGRFVKIEELDAAFNRPRRADQVPLAYFQASMVCEFIDEKLGFDTILRMLEMFKGGADTPAVLSQAIQMSPEEFDRAFDDYLRSRSGGYIEALGSGPGPGGAAAMPREVLATVLAARPNDYFAHLRLGSISRSEGDADKAIEHFKRAIELFPFYVGEGNPYLQLADLYESSGRKREAAESIAALARVDETNVGALKRLALLRRDLGDLSAALDALVTSFYVSPFDASLHKLAGDVYLQVGNTAAAVREFRVLVALNPPDLAQAHYDLALALEANGNRDEARREVLRSLEIAPGFEKAQLLLLRLRRAA